MIKKTFQFLKKYFSALFGSLYLFTFGILSARHRAFLLIIAEHFGYREGPSLPPAILPEFSPDAIIAGVPITLVESVKADGNVTELELIVLAAAVQKKGASRCFEIGTFDGRTALNLALNSPENALIYTLDLPPEAHSRREGASDDIKFVGIANVGRRFKGTPYASKIIQMWGDSATFDYSPYEHKMDLVFIDGSHHYNHVLSDTKNAMRMTKPGSIIFWHDYGGICEGVTRALNNFYKEEKEFKNLKRIAGTALVYLER